MLKSINFKTIMILLVFFSMLLLSYLHEAKAYTSVVEPGSGRGILTCPTGEEHKGPIAFEARSIASSMTGDWDISTPSASGSGEVFKSGVISEVKISPSGEFFLRGKEITDDICGSLGSVSSIPIEIMGQCVPAGSPLTTVNFRSSTGERADFPSSPTCT